MPAPSVRPVFSAKYIWIPASQGVSQLTRRQLQRIYHSGLDPESIFFFRNLNDWMPDQVRHDGRQLTDFLKYDTVCFAGMTSSG
jgi:hypothetical protein